MAVLSARNRALIHSTSPRLMEREFFYDVPAQPIPETAIRDLEGAAKAAADGKQIAP